MNRKLDYTYQVGDPGEGYIKLNPDRTPRSQVKIDNKSAEGLDNFRGEIILDLDENGRIVGIELLGDIIPDNLRE